MKFLSRIKATNFQERVQQYAMHLCDKRTTIGKMKKDLIKSAFQSHGEKELSSYNLYEEAFHYRKIFLRYKLKNSELTEHQRDYLELLSQIKMLYYRVKLSKSSVDRKKAISRAMEKTIHLGDLECEFYKVFSNYI